MLSVQSLILAVNVVTCENTFVCVDSLSHWDAGLILSGL